MPRPLEYPLNPMDNILLATHESLRQRGYCGLNVVLLADLEGPLDPDKLAAAVQRLGRLYPALSARIRYSRFLRRAYWRIDHDADVEAAVEYELHETWESGETVDTPLRAAMDDSLDPTRGPQVRLVHMRLGQDRHRLGLRWPHHFMDLEGAHRLLGELEAILADRLPTLGQDPRATFPDPYPEPFPRSMARVWQGRCRHYYHCAAHQPRLVAKPIDERKTANFQLRRYDSAFRRRFEALAREHVPPGPMRHARGILGTVARTYFDMCRERGRLREQYLFSHVLPVPRVGQRPGVHGNYVTMPWVAFTAEDLASRSGVDAAAAKQLADYASTHAASATWNMYRATQRWPFAAARLLMTHQVPRAAAGTTSYRFNDSVTRLGKARITNLAAVGTMNCHPGWIVANSSYEQSMSIAVTYFEDYVDTSSVTEFLDRLERRLAGD